MGWGNLVHRSGRDPAPSRRVDRRRPSPLPRDLRTAMSSTLSITGLDVAFGARTLFAGLDLNLADGDVTAVVGPNGSGKSDPHADDRRRARDRHGHDPARPPRRALIAWLPQVLPDPQRDVAGLRSPPHGSGGRGRGARAASAAIGIRVRRRTTWPYAAERGPLRRVPSSGGWRWAPQTSNSDFPRSPPRWASTWSRPTAGLPLRR